jgi:glutamate dehydrogenase
MPSKTIKSTTDLIEEIKPISIISKILRKLPKNPLIRSFSTVYLNSLPDRILTSFSVDHLTQFIQNRYTFFITHSNKTQCHFELIKLPDSRLESDLFALELTCPDAYFLLITLELMLQNYSARITKMYHPILQVVRKKTIITEIKKPETETELRSLIYIEFELHSSDKSLINGLKKEILQKVNAIQYAQKDHCNMLNKLTDIKQNMQIHPSPIPNFHNEWIDLLDWLKHYNYSFFGYCSFDIKTHNVTPKITLNPDSCQGILTKGYAKYDSTLLSTLKKKCKRFVNYRSPFIFDIIHYISPIQRFENLMRLSIKIPVSKTKIIEHNFIGLLKRSSLLVKNQETPIIRLKMDTIIKNRHLLPGSYDYNQIIRIFTYTPKFELFRTPTELLYQMVDNLLSITNPNEIHCFTRKKIDLTTLFLMVVVPLPLFTQKNITAITRYLNSKIPNESYEIIEVKGIHLCWINVTFEQPIHPPFVLDLLAIEADIKELIKPWEELLKLALSDQFSISNAKLLYKKYFLLFPPHHRVRRTPHETIRDIISLEKLEKTNQIQFNLVPFLFPDSLLHQKASILFIYNTNKIDLINIMPILHNLGVHVFDELTTRVGPKSNIVAYIHSFRIANQDRSFSKLNEEKIKPILIDLLDAIFNGNTSNDPLNALSVKAYLSWRQLNIIKTYRAYLLQIDLSTSREKINATLLKNITICKLMVTYFEEKFDPVIKEDSHKRQLNRLSKLNSRFFDNIRKVSDITEDIILKRLFSIIENTLRTNYFIPKPLDYFISIKLDTQKIKLSLPVPYREIFIYDTEMEGTHLRFGPIARGGVRWSDRRDDFRREILGLVKTQHTKNVVIIPVGSKGGFVIKKELFLATRAVESKKQYQKFIKGLFDITDTITPKGKIKAPLNVVRYDDNDPYLVVAADKGTASFSDYANEISKEYDFWLGDAFASGGSNGYNHKKIGITAKGAWECVKIHFKEMGVDSQKDPITVSGIGDMSGDVFGNGMLLSKSLKLQAAFNHDHIFLDPNPDPAQSWKERYRLFNMTASTWSDYDANVLSKGGGVFDRHAKEIKLSSEIQMILNTTEKVLNGDELVKTILKMNVDLLWFGGIGTYIKASDESSYQVGDPANDSIRIDHIECNASVVGEGANLGITQFARIELSRNGVCINTDFIDNSGGVNMSDYEVNLKILLTQLFNDNIIKTINERNQILTTLTDDVTSLVLTNSRNDHRLLSMDQLRSNQDSGVFFKLITHMITTKQLNPIQENIPDISELETIFEHQELLPRPLLATIQAYVKMDVYNHLIQSPLIAKENLQFLYHTYFPTLIYDLFMKEANRHRLKNEIICTLLTNTIVNQAGTPFFFKMEQLSTKPIDEIAIAYLLIDQLIDGPTIKLMIFDSKSSCATHYKQLLVVESIIETLTLDLLQLPNITPSLSLFSKLNTIKQQLVPKQSKDLAIQLESLQKYNELCNLFYLSQIKKINIKNSMKLLVLLDELFDFKWLNDQLVLLDLSVTCDINQKELLLHTLNLVKRFFTEFIVTTNTQINTLSKADILTQLKGAYSQPIKLYLQNLCELKNNQSIDLTYLAVTINQLSVIPFSI